MNDSDNTERLREVLRDLERIGRRERQLRTVETSILEAVKILSLAENRIEAFNGLLEVLRNVLGFEQAAFFTPNEKQILQPIVYTCEWIASIRFSPQRMLERVLKGQIVAAFNPGVIPEWQIQSLEIQNNVRSALHIPIRTGVDSIIFICTHSLTARFDQYHIEIAKRFCPLAEQIFQKLDLRNVLAVREQERQVRLAMFNAVVMNIQAGVLVEDVDRRVFTINDTLRNIFAIAASGSDLIGSDAATLVSCFSHFLPDPQSFVCRIEELVQTRSMVNAEMLFLTNGQILERDYVPVFLPDGSFIAHFWQFRDITARYRAEEQLRHKALHDPLTSLPNRARFTEEVQLALQRTKSDLGYYEAVMFLDLDGFKMVNDRLGHAAGDELLIAFAKRLRTAVREHDIVSRLGGDEFTILLKNILEPQDAVIIAQGIIESMFQPFLVFGEELTVTTSIGIFICNHKSTSAEQVMHDADQAMYYAKSAGKNCFRVFGVLDECLETSE